MAVRGISTTDTNLGCKLSNLIFWFHHGQILNSYSILKTVTIEVLDLYLAALYSSWLVLLSKRMSMSLLYRYDIYRIDTISRMLSLLICSKSFSLYILNYGGEGPRLRIILNWFIVPKRDDPKLFDILHWQDVLQGRHNFSVSSISYKIIDGKSFVVRDSSPQSRDKSMKAGPSVLHAVTVGHKLWSRQARQRHSAFYRLFALCLTTINATSRQGALHFIDGTNFHSHSKLHPPTYQE